LYFNEKKKRVFNLKFGDRIVANEIDIVALVGKSAAYDEYTEFELKDEAIYFKGAICPSAYDPINKNMRVVFEKTSYDNPKVDGIVLYRGTLDGIIFPLSLFMLPRH